MQRFELKRHVSRRLVTARRLGSADPDAELTISILLHAKDASALADELHAVSDPANARYGRYLSPEELRRFVAPGWQDIDAVVAWLNDAGLAADEPTGARTVIRARGTVEKVTRALEVPIGAYAVPGAAGGAVRGASRAIAVEKDPSIPIALAPLVRGIAGLNTFPPARFFPPPMAPPRRWRGGLVPPERGPAGGYSPVAIREAYAIPQGATGAGERISVRGGKNDYRGRTGDADVEVALDMDWVRGRTPRRRWRSRPGRQTRQLFQTCALAGITFVCASGDAGAADEIPGSRDFDGQRHVDFPSMVPEVTSVGGTKLVEGARGFTESAWNDGAKGGASGGGFSRFVRVPAWQVKAVGRGVPMRGVPDVAAVASPDPGLAIHVRKQWSAAGGTSVAAPIWAGVSALVNEARVKAGRPRVGAVNPALYRLPASAFRDVVKGDNGYGGVPGFPAGKGWDAVTGLGSPRVDALLAKL